jgi:uncharacterized protein YcaQ
LDNLTLDSLSLRQARRLAVRAQLLAGPRQEPGIEGLRRVLRALRCLQLDPVSVVARSHLLVLWSRLGEFDRADLDTLLWRDRWLFEYWAHAASIVLTEDYPVHQVMMRAYPRYQEYRAWLAANEPFREYILNRLREAGPLAAQALEDRRAVGWVSTGWTHGRNVDQMLDLLWKQGAITVAGRNGPRRLWRVADFDAAPELTREEAVARAAELALLALGVARERDIVRHFTRDRYPGLDLAARDFARRVRVEGGTEDWWVHADAFVLLEEEWRSRTTLLSPFDNLICDRERTQRLWGFAYKNEMYVPKQKRRYGAYTMPVLSGEALIGRVVPRMDRRRGVLVVEGVYAEDGAPADAGQAIATAISSLAAFAGGSSVSYQGPVCERWAEVLTGR